MPSSCRRVKAVDNTRNHRWPTSRRAHIVVIALYVPCCGTACRPVRKDYICFSSAHRVRACLLGFLLFLTFCFLLIIASACVFSIRRAGMPLPLSRVLLVWVSTTPENKQNETNHNACFLLGQPPRPWTWTQASVASSAAVRAHKSTRSSHLHGSADTVSWTRFRLFSTSSLSCKSRATDVTSTHYTIQRFLNENTLSRYNNNSPGQKHVFALDTTSNVQRSAPFW